MSWNPLIEDRAGALTADRSSIATLIVPRSRDIGSFSVRRALPAAQRQMVGPFIFFDHMGPVEFLSGQGIDVRPHPHIGLATVTYLFEGEFQHRDSLGTNQMIYPGDVNWMIAGAGVTHSERTSAATRRNASRLAGIQTWVALPDVAEDTPAAFQHVGKADLPLLEGEGKRLRLIIGRAYGESAPITTFTDMFYIDANLAPGARLPLPLDHEDRGVHVFSGSIDVAGDTFESGRMIVFRPGDAISLRAGEQGARLLLLGGATLNGPRYIWWNFVASSRERIEAAKAAWRDADFVRGRFHLPPGDDQEFIPAPER